MPQFEIDAVWKKLEKGWKRCEQILKYFDENNNGSNVYLEKYREAYKNAEYCSSVVKDAHKDIMALIDKYRSKNNYISDFNLNDLYNYLNNFK